MPALVVTFLGWIALGPEVQWEAPASCPDAATARDAIAKDLDPDAEVEVLALVTEEDGTLVAEVEVRTADGVSTRTLRSRDCGSLLDATGLIARAAQRARVPEPEAQTEGETAPEASPSNAEASVTAGAAEPAPMARTQELDDTLARPVASERPPPATPPSAAQGRDQDQGAPPRYRPYVRGFGLIGWGLTPLLDGGGGAAIGVAGDRLRLEAFGLGLAPTRHAFEIQEDASVRIAGWSAGARVCGVVWRSQRRGLGLPLCMGAEGGQLLGRGEGRGLARTDRHIAPFAALSAGAGLDIRLGPRLHVLSSLDGVVPVVRPGFALQDLEDVAYAPARVGVRATIGLEVHFGRRIEGSGGMR